MKRIVYGPRWDDKDCKFAYSNPSLEAVCYRFIVLYEHFNGQLDEDDMWNSLNESCKLIVSNYNPDEWKDYLMAAIAWGVAEPCFSCKRIHPLVGVSCPKA